MEYCCVYPALWFHDLDNIHFMMGSSGHTVTWGTMVSLSICTDPEASHNYFTTEKQLRTSKFQGSQLWFSYRTCQKFCTVFISATDTSSIFWEVWLKGQSNLHVALELTQNRELVRKWVRAAIPNVLYILLPKFRDAHLQAACPFTLEGTSHMTGPLDT